MSDALITFHSCTANVTLSDKIGLIAEKYTCSYYGLYHFICSLKG